MSTRSVVLDDGLGGKIVGWREGDLAAMELEPVREAPAPKREIKAPIMAPPPPPVPRPAAVVSPFAATESVPVTPAPVIAAPVAAPAPVAAAPHRRLPGIATAPVPVAKPAAKPAPQPAPASVVAPMPEPEEDEWEWEIAMARARAAAEWAAEGASGFTKPADPIKAEAWPKTEPLHEVWEATPAPLRTERVVKRPNPATKPPPIGDTTAQMRPAPPRAKSTTVIPVPALPVAADPRSIRPVISPPRASITAAPPRRIPRATSRFEETIRTHAASPVNDDATSPNIALPPASAGKRVAAKQK